MDPERETATALAERIVRELVAEEAAFVASVQVGDVVFFTEWVWTDPVANSERRVFQGTVACVYDGVHGKHLQIDPATVEPSGYLQRLRLDMPASFFRAEP